MIISYFKQYYIILLIIVCSTIFNNTMQCMNVVPTKLDSINTKSIIGNVQNIANNMQKIGLVIMCASQIPEAFGQETKAECYQTCAQNCSVTISPMCDLTPDKVALPLTLIAVGLFTGGGLIGCCISLCKDK